MTQEVDKCRCKSYHQHLPSNELGFINIMKPVMTLISQLDTIQDVMDDVRLVLENLDSLREELSEEAYEELDATPVGSLLDSLEDLRYSIEQAEQ